MKTSYATTQLLLDQLTLNDAEFIFELLNTAEWKKFIGDRNIQCIEDAKKYIQKISDTANTNYWVVRIQDVKIPIGIITLIKRDYLEHPDIGFAFLAAYSNLGYAFESSKAVLDDLIKSGVSEIYAITVSTNVKSIKLLTKLGFGYNKEIINENESLELYSIKTG
jgi:[ribosomal protein S5]-alanine N-acetyltransferase